MTPHEFITKWRASELKERSASQEHFIDLCRLLGEPTPADADPTGETYCFERGARRDTGGDGWADVWKRHHFAWEYKGRRANLDAAFNQLRQYALALENPPLLIVSDMVRFRNRTNWTNSVSRTHEFELDDLADALTRDRLKWAFSDPERLRPGETRQSLTERVAASFASVAQARRERGHDPQAVAHFVNRLVFCMFADDVGLLPDHMFTRMLRHAQPAPARVGELAGELFRAMASGGRVGFETVAWFNGSLFNDDTTLPLEKPDIETVLAASDLDWSEIDPSILGTLFERGLDPDKRAQLGAHYTDRDKIMLLVEPVVILTPLDTIECRDAILTPDDTEQEWPAADVVIGNPPFLGGKLLITHLGEDYVSRMFGTYAGRVPAEADLVCYWFEKAGQQIACGRAARAGLVATNSIRGGANRRALQAATGGRRIFDAWSDEPWLIAGAAVRVSLVCFSRADDELVREVRLDGQLVDEIYTDLTPRLGDVGVDLTAVRRLPENAGVAFMGDTKGGPFDVAGDQAREWLRLPANPNGRTNADVMKPWVNGMDLTRRSAGKWVVDFGWTMSEGDVALYEEPFRWLKNRVYPIRQRNRLEAHRLKWWRHLRPRPEMWGALDGLSRYIATPTVAKHRLFVWYDARICPDYQLIVIARAADTTFGVLHSRFHELWSLRLCTWLGKGNDPRYTPSTTFETFPFPAGLTPNVPALSYAVEPRANAIAEAARRLVKLRDRWLNPPEWVEWVDEPAPRYPRRSVPRDEDAAKALKKRTLTNLYNARPQWLSDAQAALDAAVAGAYGWSADISGDDVLREMLDLNRSR